MIKLTVIVPVYNVEKYLHRCIDSILNQTFKDFELILVNDGSTDKSGEICDDYQLKDSRIKVIHKQNEGVSIARNIGISLAQGEYIQFVDSDDYLDTNMFEKSLMKIEADQSDILFFGFYNEYNNGDIYKEKKFSHIDIFENNDFFIELYRQDLFGYTWCKLFKKDIIDKNKLVFNKYLKYCEDEEFTCHYCCYVQKLSILQECLYHYINYDGQRKNLSSAKDKDELMNRDFLFKSWHALLGAKNTDYLMKKAFNNLKFNFFNIVWSNQIKDMKVNQIKKIKKSYMFYFLNVNKRSFQERALVYFINLKSIIVFKLFYRSCLLFKLDF